jgi:hypothetical protein
VIANFPSSAARVDLELGEAPGMRPQAADAAAHRAFRRSDRLLEMLARRNMPSVQTTLLSQDMF